MSRKRTVILNTLFQLLGKGVTGLVSFAISILLASQLGLTGYGDYTKITTFVAFFWLLSDFGVNALYVKTDTSDTHNSFGSLLALRLLFSAVLITTASGISLLLPSSGTNGYPWFIKTGIMLYSITILFQSMTMSANALFQKNLRYDLSVWASVSGSIVSLVGLLCISKVFLVSQNVLSSLLIMITGIAITSCVSLYLAKTRIRFSFQYETQTMKKLFFLSLPVGLTLLFNVAYFRIDSVILALTRTTAEVGAYGFAYKIFEFLLVIPSFFMNSLYPILLEEEKNRLSKNHTSHSLLISKSAVFLFLSGCILSCVIFIATPIIATLKGFDASITPLRILSLSLPFFFLTSLFMWLMIVRSKQKQLAYIYGFSLMVNCIGNILLIPRYGMSAASIMTGATEIMTLLLLLYFVSKK